MERVRLRVVTGAWVGGEWESGCCGDFALFPAPSFSFPVHACACAACVCVHVRVCVRACVRACVRVHGSIHGVSTGIDMGTWGCVVCGVWCAKVCVAYV
jgi:hypothetical protein